jgi:hypothetical protein
MTDRLCLFTLLSLARGWRRNDHRAWSYFQHFRGTKRGGSLTRPPYVIKAGRCSCLKLSEGEYWSELRTPIG